MGMRKGKKGRKWRKEVRRGERGEKKGWEASKVEERRREGRKIWGG